MSCLQRVATCKQRDAAPVLFGRAASVADQVRRLGSLNGEVSPRSDGRPTPTSRTPERNDLDVLRRFTDYSVVDVVVNPLDMDKANTGEFEIRCARADVRAGSDERTDTFQLLADGVRCLVAILSPPPICLPYLAIG